MSAKCTTSSQQFMGRREVAGMVITRDCLKSSLCQSFRAYRDKNSIEERGFLTTRQWWLFWSKLPCFICFTLIELLCMLVDCVMKRTIPAPRQSKLPKTKASCLKNWLWQSFRACRNTRCCLERSFLTSHRLWFYKGELLCLKNSPKCYAWMLCEIVICTCHRLVKKPTSTDFSKPSFPV